MNVGKDLRKGRTPEVVYRVYGRAEPSNKSRLTVIGRRYPQIEAHTTENKIGHRDDV